jgi:hypothetical protein
MKRAQTRKIVTVNADKPSLWKSDVAASVDQFNRWFLDFAPATFREERIEVTERVRRAILTTENLCDLTVDRLILSPEILGVLRMCTAPPIAQDRLVGLAQTTKGLIKSMEKGKISRNFGPPVLQEHLDRIVRVLDRLLDRDIFSWLSESRHPTEAEKDRAATIVADRLCGAITDPLIRNGQEKRQLAEIGRFLTEHGYQQKQHPLSAPLTEMELGTFSFRLNVTVGSDTHPVKIPVDTVIQPRKPFASRLPLLVEAKSAGDFTNVNKRRKEEAQKFHQLKDTFGNDIQLILFLCGYFDTPYLGYSAAEGLDWVWEHRIDDLLKFGI